MKTWFFALILALMAAPAGAAQFVAYFNLAGVNEVNAQTGDLGAGDPDGWATAQILIDPDADSLTWHIWYQNLGELTAMHIHRGAFGVNGPVWKNLMLPGGHAGNGHLMGLVHDLPADLPDLLANPLGFYLNIHTNEFPGGAVRNQMVPVPEPGVLAMTGLGLGVLLLRGRARGRSQAGKAVQPA